MQNVSIQIENNKKYKKHNIYFFFAQMTKATVEMKVGGIKKGRHLSNSLTRYFLVWDAPAQGLVEMISLQVG